jgi:hypothetical protein
LKGKGQWHPHEAEKTATHLKTFHENLMSLPVLSERTDAKNAVEVKLLIGLLAMQLSWFQLLKLSRSMDMPSGSVTRAMAEHLQSEFSEMESHLRSMSGQLKTLIFTLMASPVIMANDIVMVGCLLELNSWIEQEVT